MLEGVNLSNYFSYNINSRIFLSRVIFVFLIFFRLVLLVYKRLEIRDLGMPSKYSDIKIDFIENNLVLKSRDWFQIL